MKEESRGEPRRSEKRGRQPGSFRENDWNDGVKAHKRYDQIKKDHLIMAADYRRRFAMTNSASESRGRDS